MKTLYIILFLGNLFSFRNSPCLHPKPAFIIIWGDISCRNCAYEIHKYFISRKKKIETVKIVYFDKKNIFANKNTEDYIRETVPKASIAPIVTISFPQKAAFPVVGLINNNDTVIIPYDKLFINTNLISYSSLDSLFKI